MRIHARFACLATLCAALLLAGCGAVDSVHPLSDEETTALDERLIGYWRLVGSGDEEQELGDHDVAPQFVVGRSESSNTQVEMVVLMLDKKGYARVRRVPVLATKLGDDRYVSLLSEDEESDEQGYILLRYALPENDVLHVWVLSPPNTAVEVELGKIEGRVEEGHGSVHLTSDTAALRAWLQERAGEVIEDEKFLVFHRLIRGPGNEYEGPDDSEAPDEEDDAEDDE